MIRRARRLIGLLLCLLLLAGLIWDLQRPPDRQWSALALLAGVHLYQRSVSPGMAKIGVRCRFEPTCSHYAAAVIARDGSLRGSWRTVVRLVRCGPWTPAGTLDQP